VNNLTKSYFKQMHQAVDALQATLQKKREYIQSQKQSQERITKELWARGKEIAALKEAVKTLDAMTRENARLRETRAELDARLTQVLEYTKALGDEFRT